MTLSPPQPAVVGQPYILTFELRDYEGGSLVDPTALQADITYGEVVGQAPDVAGPFTWSGATSEASDTIWQTGTGQFSFRWEVPLTGLLPGDYVMSWTVTYGPGNDLFLGTENFVIQGGGPFLEVPPGDLGYWLGSIAYTPQYGAPVSVPFGAVDANGIAWLYQSLTGWDSPPAVGAVIQRSADHGGWPAAQYFGPRTMTLTLVASAATQALRDQARAILQQAVPSGTTGTDLALLTVGEPVPKQALVRRNASSQITETYLTFFDVIFQVPLVAPDPRKYGTVTQTAQVTLPVPVISPLAWPLAGPLTFPGGLPAESVTLTAVNDGNFETRPQITLTGPVVGPSIVNGTTGQAISYSGLSLGSTDVLTIDTDNRQSFLNQSFVAADPSSSWWVLSPGATTIYVNGVSPGGATLSCSYNSAWI